MLPEVLGRYGEGVERKREAGRVVRPGGVVVVAVISRWASALSGLHSGFLREEEFARIVADDLATGVHRNPDNRPGWFTTAYFHRPEELTREVEEAGLVLDGPVAVEGLGGAAPDIDGLLDDDAVRERVLDVLRRTEREPALLGMSSHLLAAGRRP
jgi:SAM-dependent methyltransferase